MTALQELIKYIEDFTPKNKTTDGIWSKAKSLIDKEKKDLEYFFNNNDYNTDFTDFEDQYEYLTLCNNISDRRMCDDCSIEFGPCKRHLSVCTSNGI